MVSIKETVESLKGEMKQVSKKFDGGLLGLKGEIVEVSKSVKSSEGTLLDRIAEIREEIRKGVPIVRKDELTTKKKKFH